MATYFLFGKYSAEAIKGISAERTKKAADIVKKFGGSVQSIHALLGPHDLVIIAELPGTREAMGTSMALHKLTSISFSTAPAISVEEFDKLAAET